MRIMWHSFSNSFATTVTFCFVSKESRSLTNFAKVANVVLAPWALAKRSTPFLNIASSWIQYSVNCLRLYGSKNHVAIKSAVFCASAA